MVRVSADRVLVLFDHKSRVAVGFNPTVERAAGSADALSARPASPASFFRVYPMQCTILKHRLVLVFL